MMESQVIEVEKIREWSNQYRLISPGTVSAMVGSMREEGQLQPVILQMAEGFYNIIDGIKRYRAALELGLDSLQACVFEVSVAMAKAMILHYNRHSRNLSMYEQGLIVSSLIHEHGISQKEVGRLLHQSKSWVCRRLGMIERLLPQVQDAIRMGSISVSHGRELLKLPRGNQALALEVVIRGLLSSRECAIVVDKLIKSKSPKESEYICKNVRDVISQVQKRETYYDVRLSDHGNRILKAREILKLEVNILGGVLRDAQTGRLSSQERAILLPPLSDLPASLGRLSELINGITQSI